ncbi:hypothetical protein P2318_32500 [Myxococcaceae bacterium GXIMD 01537]
MSDWIPKPNRAVDPRALPLTAEEGFVLSRLDGTTPASHLGALTGLPAERLSAILQRLLAQGALLPEAPAPARPPTPPPQAGAGAIPAGAGALSTPPPAEEPGPEVAHEAGPGGTEAGDAEAAHDDVAGPDDAEAEPDDAVAAGNYRQLFETRLHLLEKDARVALAHTAEDPELSALCFDPLPAVIQAVLENARVGLAHARLIARNHRNPVGLEALCARAAFAADAGVRRWLVRNPQLPASLFRRLWGTRRMLELNKVALDRDVPEPTRRTAREVLRQRFATGPAEEKVEFILQTEGRALTALSGLPVDSKTASLLCGRTYRSAMLVQNIARWSAAPPALVAHLLRQELVRRQPMLRTLLARHPNAPADAKRGGS